MKETALCKIHKENEIVHIQFNEHITLNLPDLSEIFAYINEVYGKAKYTKLIDIRSNMAIDEKAKEFIKVQAVKSEIVAQAILAGKNTPDEVFTAFTGMISQKIPTRVFTDYESAVKWLSSSRPLN